MNPSDPHAHDAPLALTDVLAGVRDALGCPGEQRVPAGRCGLEPGEQVLVVLVDGLGLVPLRDAFAHAPFLRSRRSDVIEARTVVPSTTAAAITAFGTGCRPGLTRMVGYSVLHEGRVMNLLAFEDGPDPAFWQPCPTHFEDLATRGLESVVISPPAFASSGLTRAALRGARHRGAVTWEERVRAAVDELRRGVRLVYLYWSELDHRGHAHGVSSREWSDALEDLDAGLADLTRRIPLGVQMLLTADHGMVDVVREDLIDLAERPELSRGVRAIAGETRALHLHAEEGRAEEVIERWCTELGEDYLVCPRSRAASLLGEGPGLDEIGDALVLARGRRGIVDSRVQTEGAIALVGVHGSLTDEEMLIPVWRLA